MLVSREPITVEIPHEPGQWIGFCKLSWKQFKQARKKAEKENREVIRELGGEILKALQVEGGEKRARKLIDEQEYDPRTYDTEELLLAGIVSWSYEAEVNPETVAALDKQTSDWAVRKLIDLNRPPSEGEEKKG